MPIHIKEIAARMLGPIDEFNQEFTDVNLIFGHNERGKTFLVEFLLRALFNHSKEFGLRDITPSGKVIVTGLQSTDQSFSLKTKKKLEDYWDNQNIGMPPNISRLLVVKGAETDFDTQQSGGISKSIIKSFLSNEDTLELIQSRIQPTVQDARLENGRVEGKRKGKIKDQQEFFSNLDAINKLLARVDQEISGGAIAKINSNINIINNRIVEQEKAKRYEAYRTSTFIDNTNSEIQDLDEGELVKLENNINDYTADLKQKDRMTQKLLEAKENSKNYSWISNAKEKYKEITRGGVVPIVRKWSILTFISFLAGGLLIIIGGVLALVGQKEIAVVTLGVSLVAFLITALFGYIHIRQYDTQANLKLEHKELIKLQDTFLEKTGTVLTDIAIIDTELERIEQDYYNVGTYTEGLGEFEQTMDTLQSQIENSFLQFQKKNTTPDTWSELTIKLRGKRKDLESKREELRVQHSGLGVDDANYLHQDPGITYDHDLLNDLYDELENDTQALRQEDDVHQLLKSKILGELQGTDMEDWSVLIEKLRNKRDTLIDACKLITSEIIAGILINDVIKEERDQEDEYIKASLKSPVIMDPLFQVTQRYKSVTFDGEIVRVLNDFEEFDAADLSTGAREQVQLGLRLGFASKIMGKETAFLILDDAFQHSDWRRRPYLVDTLFRLAKKGWQILYFSMDDHIQELFDKTEKTYSGVNYKKIVLPE